MTELIYNISKEAASQLLGVSTRTIDRYLASGRMSSRKKGNKVMLAQEEVLTFKKESDDIEINDVEVVSVSDYHRSINANEASYGAGTNNTSLSLGAEQLGEMLETKFNKFATMLENKDNLLEEKNALIFSLQKKIGEMESKIQSMIALPDHQSEREQLLDHKKELQNRLDNLNKSLSKEETKNNIFIGILVIVGIIIIMLMFWNPSSGTPTTPATSDNTLPAVEEVN